MARWALVVLVSCACAGGGDDPCRVNADCPSGHGTVCGPGGVCVPLVDAGAPGDASADAAPATGDGGACAPDHDGVLRRSEVPLAAGLMAPFRAAAGATVSTAGTTQGDGTRRWDLSGALAGDHTLLVETLPLSGAWYAPSFPTATYAARLSESSDLHGVFEATGDALLLLGVVSPAGGAARTELTYDPPVTVYAFPLQAGANWSTQATVSGLAQGFAAFYDEDYASVVDARGTLATPFGDFPVVRVKVVLTRTVGVVQTTVRTYAFAAECFGTVATIVSQDDEPSEEFTSAAEVRRLEP